MGYEQLESVIQVRPKSFWAGWHPGKTHNDIPGELENEKAPIGAVDCNSVIWHRGRLQKMFGYAALTNPTLESGADITSLHYSPNLLKTLGTVNDALYYGMETATPTEITGAATITAAIPVQMVDWEFSTTQYVVGVQSGNTPWKWDGTGTATVLGGSPPTGKWSIQWQDALWIADGSVLHFSGPGDPETWAANDNYKLDATITGLASYGEMLVVFMEDHIGILAGTNNQLLTKVSRYIEQVGCTGGFTIQNVKVQGRELILFHGTNGFYAFDGTRNLVKISNAISEKYTDGSSVTKWNEGRYSRAWGKYVPQHGWYMCSLSDGSDTDNGFLLVFDLNKWIELPNLEGVSIPIWPCSDQVEELSCIEVPIDSSGDRKLLFGSNDGVVYEYDASLYSRNGEAYTCYFQSKIFDLGRNVILLEANVLGDELGGAGELTTWVNFDMETGSGNQDTQDMTGGGDQLEIDWTLGTSILGGSNQVFKNFAIVHYGRFFQFRWENNELDQSMKIHGSEFIFKDIGLMPNAGR